MNEPTQAWKNQMETIHVGSKLIFDITKDRRVEGTCLACEYSGLTDIGELADFRLTMEGSSGKMVSVSMVESRARDKELERYES